MIVYTSRLRKDLGRICSFCALTSILESSFERCVQKCFFELSLRGGFITRRYMIYTYKKKKKNDKK